MFRALLPGASGKGHSLTGEKADAGGGGGGTGEPQVPGLANSFL